MAFCKSNTLILMNEQSRINAMISYLFLGPIFFLFGKEGTPLWDTYVRWHAKKASIIIGATIIACLIYFFLLKNLIDFTIPFIGIHIHTVILGIIMATCMIFLLSGAYRAYSWIDSSASSGVIHMPFSIDTSSDEIIWEENKIRILGSMLPFIGIYLAKKYHEPLMIRSRILGSFFMFCIIVSLYFGSNESLLSVLLVCLYILLIVIQGVYVFIGGKFLRISFFEKIPSYEIIDSYIIASIKYIFEFTRIIFGGEHRISFHDLVHIEQQKSAPIKPESPYFMPTALLAIPFWNIVALPSLFIDKYREYRYIIIQGLIITSLMGFIIFYLGNPNDPFLLLFIFPIFHIALYSSENINIRSPGIGLIIGLFWLFQAVQNKIQDAQSIRNEERFTYDIKD